MVNSISNMTNLKEVINVVKTRNKKMMTILYVRFYPVACTGMAYITYLRVNIFRMTHAMNLLFKINSEEEIHVLNK